MRSLQMHFVLHLQGCSRMFQPLLKALAAATRGERLELSLPLPTPPPSSADVTPAGFYLQADTTEAEMADPPKPAIPTEARARSEHVSFTKAELAAMKGRCVQHGATLQISGHDAMLVHMWRLVHTLPGRAAPSAATFVLDYRSRLPDAELGPAALGNHFLYLSLGEVDVGEVGEGELADLVRRRNIECTPDVARASIAWLQEQRAAGLLGRVLPGAASSIMNGPRSTLITTDWRLDAYSIDFGAGPLFLVDGLLSAGGEALMLPPP